MSNKQREFTSFKKDIVRITNNKDEIKRTLDYDEAELEILKYLTEKNVANMKANGEIKENRNLTKSDLIYQKKNIRNTIVECIMSKNISIRGYLGEKLEDFINIMVNEFAGYSILEEALSDEGVTDVYCLSWNKIYLERNGENVDFPNNFKNKDHYKDFVDRLLRRAGKELNIGDNKIVDFEIYGNRGCCTSDAVTPKDITLTIRKHKDDPVDVDDLLYQNVINQEILDFFDLIIDGQSNIIYAGITGTGKTTTIRSLLERALNRNKQRAITCEDTQELFLKNGYTMQMVSSRTDDENTDVSLYKLVITALRLKPRYIIVGEVRAEEAQAAVEAMETGHSTIFTLHAGKPINAINRVVSKYIMKMPNLTTDVVERIIGEAVDFIAIQDYDPIRKRYLSSISEVSFDYEKNKVKLETILVYDFFKDDWVWKKRINRDKCINLMRRGCTRDVIEKWMDTEDVEVEKEALEKMNQNYYKDKSRRQESYKNQQNIKLMNKYKERAKQNNIDIEITPDSDFEKIEKMINASYLNEIKESLKI